MASPEDLNPQRPSLDQDQNNTATSSDSAITSEPQRPRRPRPKHDFPETQAGKLWKAFEKPEGGPVNEMPGGTFNTAGGKPKEISWTDAFRFDQFGRKDQPIFYKQPCARDSLLVGIASGGGVGGLRFILRGLNTTWVTANYAVGTFALSAAGMFYWCQRRRKEEARGMAAAVAGMKMLHEKKAREEAQKKQEAEEARRKEEEERERNKRWWKPW